MDEPGQTALVDLAGIDLTAPVLGDGSVLDRALERIIRERGTEVPQYASFMNECARTGDRAGPARDRA
ncbi:hypothetical protein AGRA3207_002039 [Actinomadura graeca]|uniref:FXSXX-COOH protein n=1 Tax=Actinomadura graeca TaxID=2750812 RepID=A0ABX8QUU5_9ACTN|nr:hypothetical protein [Actinomadura graeca]QXJ21207.1 hypothetical protein AGRA3207_002039 [Actinomadura graeca]